MESALSSVLGELRVSGAVVLSQAHPIPWSIEVPPARTLRGVLGAGDDVTIVPFHLAERGHFELDPVDGDSVVVQARELVMCANGQGHTMGSGEANVTQTFEEVMQAGSFGVRAPCVGATEVICGVFMLRNTKNNPLIDALPNLVKVSVAGDTTSHSMRQLYEMFLAEIGQERPGQSFMLERILELLYAEAIRLYTESDQHQGQSWLTAIHDSRVAPAINYIHSHLGEELTIENLAKIVSLSPSRFSTCFRDHLGLSPHAYITRQRQMRAAQRLVESRLTVQEIAHECGYQSMPSFNKAFVKHHGCAPGRWRKQNAPSGS